MSSAVKVLVIFDQPATLRELVSSSNEAGVKLLPVRDRRAALSAVQTQADAGAIIVEKSAASNNALEILQNSQTLRPRLRRILIMDSPDLTTIVNGLHSGEIDAILYRPIDAKQLYSAVMDSTLCSEPASSARSNAQAVAERR